MGAKSSQFAQQMQDSDSDALWRKSMEELDKEAKRLRQEYNARQTSKNILVAIVSLMFSFVIVCMFLLGKRGRAVAIAPAPHMHPAPLDTLGTTHTLTPGTQDDNNVNAAGYECVKTV